MKIEIQIKLQIDGLERPKGVLDNTVRVGMDMVVVHLLSGVTGLVNGAISHVFRPYPWSPKQYKIF